MKILVTNDDSISALGLKILIEVANKYGEVLVVAPKYEQSGKSHAINVHSGFKVTKYPKLFDGIDAYSVDSSPADCVRFAYYHLKYDFDVVLSGVNNGYNVGEDILYSGTVAAASEALFREKKGIAVSTARGEVSKIKTGLENVLDYVFKNNILAYGELFNINFSPSAKEIVFTKQGKSFYDTRFDLEDDGLYYQRGNEYVDFTKNDIHTDLYAIHNNLISITPLTVDRTDFTIYEKIKNHK